MVAVIGLASSTQPEVVHYLPWLGSVARTDSFHSALATAIAPALAGVLFVWISLAAIRKAARYSGAVSVSVARLKAFKAVFWVFVIVAGIWIVAAGSLIIGVRALDDGQNAPSSIANGSVTTAIFLLIILLNIAIIAPGLLLLQPVRLWKMWKAKKRARTPRQLFRGQHGSVRLRLPQLTRMSSDIPQGIRPFLCTQRLCSRHCLRCGLCTGLPTHRPSSRPSNLPHSHRPSFSRWLRIWPYRLKSNRWSAPTLGSASIRDPNSSTTSPSRLAPPLARALDSRKHHGRCRCSHRLHSRRLCKLETA